LIIEESQMPTFRIRTLASGYYPQEVRTEVEIKSRDLTEARRRADAIAQAEALWRSEDRIEISADDETLLAERKSGQGWRTYGLTLVE